MQIRGDAIQNNVNNGTFCRSLKRYRRKDIVNKSQIGDDYVCGKL